jgi:hypothetical protein
MVRHKTLPIHALWTFFGLLWAAPAAAQTPAEAEREARARFLRGVELYDQGQYAAALAEFERAYARSRNPSVLYNVSLAQEGAGRYADALASLRRYAREAPRRVVEARRAAVDAGLTRLELRVGTLVVTSAAPGLAVTVDGLEQPLEALREGITVNAGVLRVVLRAPGRVPRELERRVAGGDRVVVDDPLETVTSSVLVSCDTPGVTVLIDGQPAGTTPLASPLAVSEGHHRVTLQRLGYVPWEREIDALGAGARVEVRLRWEDPLPAEAAARVVLRASEPDVIATLDGRRIPVDGSLPVPAGPHRLRVEREAFLPTERSLTLLPGERQEVRLVLVPTPAHQRELQAADARRRTLGWGFLGPGLAVAVGGGTWLALALGSYLQTSEAFSTFDQTYQLCFQGMAPAGTPCESRFTTAQRTALGAEADSDLVQVILGIVTTTLGVASASLGAIVLLSGGARERSRPAPLAQLSVVPGGLQLRW